MKVKLIYGIYRLTKNKDFFYYAVIWDSEKVIISQIKSLTNTLNLPILHANNIKIRQAFRLFKLNSIYGHEN